MGWLRRRRYCRCYDFQGQLGLLPGLPGLLSFTKKGPLCFQWMALFLFHKTLTNPGHFLIVMSHTEVASLQQYLTRINRKDKIAL